jgi:hypothetical protein
VRIDIPNGLDAAWKIDVKKASAQPPPIVRERLRRIIERIGATSKRVYTSRGRRLTEDNPLPVWVRIQDKTEVVYRLNTQHPVFAEFLDRLPQNSDGDFVKVLELIGATLPVDALFADFGGEPEKVHGQSVSDDALFAAVKTTYRRLLDAGTEADSAREMMHLAEPFRSNWQKTQEYLDNLSQEGNIHV